MSVCLPASLLDAWMSFYAHQEFEEDLIPYLLHAHFRLLCLIRSHAAGKRRLAATPHPGNEAFSGLHSWVPEQTASCRTAVQAYAGRAVSLNAPHQVERAVAVPAGGSSSASLRVPVLRQFLHGRALHCVPQPCAALRAVVHSKAVLEGFVMCEGQALH